MKEDNGIPLTTYADSKKAGFSPRELVMRYIPFLPWIAAIVIISLAAAYTRLHFMPNVYSVTGNIMVQDPNSMGSSADKFNEILFTEPARNLEDEMQVIKSRNLAKRVVKSLGLEVLYYNKGKVRSTLVSPRESPLILDILSLNDSSAYFSIELTVINEREFRIGENNNVLFSQPFETSAGRFRISYRPNLMGAFASNDFIIDYSSTENRAVELISNTYAGQSGTSNTIIQLQFQTENPKLGIVIVDQWMEEYQKAGLEEKRQVALGALGFINEQLDTVRLNLTSVERNLLGYREDNKVYNTQVQSEKYFTQLTDLEKESLQQGVQLEVLNNLLSYISDTKNPYRQVGSVLGIAEPTLVQQLGEFNNLQVQRETLLKTTTSENPMVKNVEAGIEKLRVSIIENLRNVKQAYLVSINNIRSRSFEANREISSMPLKENKLLDITRRQKILEQLYSLLLQKKLETSISAASTISNVKVIEAASSSFVPIKPNKKGTYTIVLFLSLAIPILLIFLMEYFNDKVRTKEDIEKETNAPIIGEISHSDQEKALVVSKTSRRSIAEQFRMIRTNLQYIIPRANKQVIMVTSTISGEGKTFISTNIGAVLALTGKRTVIFEFDIRKPKVASTLGLSRKTGITNFLIGNSTFEELPIPIPDVENLYVIPCGPVPPNPAELLLSDKISELMEKAKEQFDVVVIDTAPIGLVSDAMTLGKFADVTLYIIRHNHTVKKQLQLLQEIYTQKKLPKVSVIVNDIKSGLGYGYQYGYGQSEYGYSYGSGYFEDDLERKGWFASFGKLKKRK
jgi:capsular exopolysaccharide synthesis family protein